MNCPNCNVPTATYSTRVIGHTRKRYQRCPQCRETFIKTLPIEHAPARPKRTALPILAQTLPFQACQGNLTP